MRRPPPQSRRRPGLHAAGPGITADVLTAAGFVVILVVAALHQSSHRIDRDAHAAAPLLAAAGIAAAGAAILLVVRQAAKAGTAKTSNPAQRLARLSGRSHDPGWASPKDLRPIELSQPAGDCLTLGDRGRKVLAAERYQSVLLVGPTQSGKTSGLAIPAIIAWEGPVVATSVKSDLVRATIEARRAKGAVDLYDPTGCTGLLATGWSPLRAATTWQGAKRLAAGLCSVARVDGGMEDAGFWYASAEKLLAPMLFAAATAGATMADVVRWIDGEDLHEALLALELAGVPEAVRAARTSYGREERQRSSVFATAETILAGYSDPAVAASAAGAGLDPSQVLDGSPRTLYCSAPARDQERLRPVFVALLRQVIDAAFEHSARTGRPLDPPLLVVLDEAANIAPLDDLDTICSTAAGHGIVLLTVWQDFAQIEGRYGRRWPTIVNNHRAKVLCAGSADPMTLDHFSSLIGEHELADHSTTVADDGRRSTTEGASMRRVAPASLLRRLAPGEAVVVYGALPPAKVRLRPYDEPRSR